MRKLATSKSNRLDPDRVIQPPLRVAYPAVSELRLQLDFVSEDKWLPATQIHTLHPPAAATFRYPCPISGCSGFFELDADVSKLLRGTGAKLSNDILCSGVRSEDRASGKPCGLRLRYRVEVKYDRKA
jgi:hypothetical protein